MSLVRLCQHLLISALFVAVNPVLGIAQVCLMPDSARATIPSGTSPTLTNAPLTIVGGEGATVQLGAGLLHYSAGNPVLDLPPGENDWLRRVELPLSSSPGEPPVAWIGNGWIIGPGSSTTPLSRDGLIETGYEEVSFIVLESLSNGWFHIRYAAGEGDAGTAWTPECALSSGPVKLDYAGWKGWFLREGASPLFFRADRPGLLRAGPSSDMAPLPGIGEDYIMEPLEVRGDWM